jgi:mono/diheme cytochrome c family protein
MNSPENKSSPLSRSSVFIIGSITTALLSGLIVLCAPKKPDLIAESAAPQNSGSDLAVAASEGATTAVGPSALREGSPAEKLYGRFCASCHGADGRAQTTMARMMSPAPTNFQVGPWKGEQNVAAIVEVIKNGKGAMPGFGKEISSETELNALAEYVLSLRKDPAQ